MSFRRAVQTSGTSIFLFATVALVAIGCGGSSSGGSGGATGTGGHGTGGHGAGGSTGVGGVIADAGFNLCQSGVISTALITDFGTMAAGFGGDGTNPGGTLYNPYGGPDPLDFTNSNMHVTGMVNNYAGVQVVYLNCTVDASQGNPPFTGIQFKIGGNVSPTGAMQMLVVTGADSPALDVGTINTTHAGCTVVTNQYVDCAYPIATFNVPTTATAAAPTTITLPWNRFSGGKPKGSVDVNDIGGFTFIFPWNPNVDGGGVAYPVDFVVDDISFIQAGSGGGDAAVDTTTD